MAAVRCEVLSRCGQFVRLLKIGGDKWPYEQSQEAYERRAGRKGKGSRVIRTATVAQQHQLKGVRGIIRRKIHAVLCRLRKC
jgi:hypothetical protein